MAVTNPTVLRQIKALVDQAVMDRVVCVLRRQQWIAYFREDPETAMAALQEEYSFGDHRHR